MTFKNKIRVLLAEDDERLNELTKIMLESSGYQVAGSALNGLEALNLTYALQPDVIFMDLNMPLMDGLETTRQIRTKFTIPVVLTSACTETPKLLAEIHQAGANAFLAKPYLRCDLIEAINRAVNPQITQNGENKIN